MFPISLRVYKSSDDVAPLPSRPLNLHSYLCPLYVVVVVVWAFSLWPNNLSSK